MKLFAWIKSWFTNTEVTPVVAEPKVELTEWELRQAALAGNRQLTPQEILGQQQAMVNRAALQNRFRPAGTTVDRSPDGDDMIAQVYLAPVVDNLANNVNNNTFVPDDDESLAFRSDSSSDTSWSGGGGSFNGGGASESWDDSSSSSSDSGSSYDSGSSDSGSSGSDD